MKSRPKASTPEHSLVVSTDGTRGDGQGSGRVAAGDAAPSSDRRQAGERRASRQPSATQRALGLLTRREHSRKELTRKLVSRGLEPQEVAAAVEKLADAGWQNDRRFAESLVRSRAHSGYGPLHIRAELAAHGLCTDAIGHALASFDGDWRELACDLVRRRYSRAEADLKIRRKAADLLIRRGFDGDCIRAATRCDVLGGGEE